ncbi:hypothetical protein HK100_005583 [Physocladia obscura]|uniref:PH domain-containing protein n=1 Tax=Physocladia obscura TaxID=109957 RepID=A0AAD5XBU4_9FUNG|nr:hypothetical protein HK100_005583 [Physocladia obscura]
MGTGKSHANLISELDGLMQSLENDDDYSSLRLSRGSQSQQQSQTQSAENDSILGFYGGESSGNGRIEIESAVPARISRTSSLKTASTMSSPQSPTVTIPIPSTAANAMPPVQKALPLQIPHVSLGRLQQSQFTMHAYLFKLNAAEEDPRFKWRHGFFVLAQDAALYQFNDDVNLKATPTFYFPITSCYGYQDSSNNHLLKLQNETINQSHVLKFSDEATLTQWLRNVNRILASGAGANASTMLPAGPNSRPPTNLTNLKGKVRSNSFGTSVKPNVDVSNSLPTSPMINNNSLLSPGVSYPYNAPYTFPRQENRAKSVGSIRNKPLPNPNAPAMSARTPSVGQASFRSSDSIRSGSSGLGSMRIISPIPGKTNGVPIQARSTSHSRVVSGSSNSSSFRPSQMQQSQQPYFQANEQQSPKELFTGQAQAMQLQFQAMQQQAQALRSLNTEMMKAKSKQIEYAEMDRQFANNQVGEEIAKKKAAEEKAAKMKASLNL